MSNSRLNMSSILWRFNLIKEIFFYVFTCKNWKDIVKARLNHYHLDKFETWNHQILTFKGEPPYLIFRDIWQQKVYTRFYLKTRSSLSTVVDIGANIGTFALYANSVWPDAMVYAYEPAPDNFELLQENVRLSRADTRIFMQPYAVSNLENGSVTLYIKKEAGWNSIYSSSNDVSVRVLTISMDGILKDVNYKPIDFMKIDCEGAEYLFLSDKHKELQNFVKYVAMEFHEIDGHSYMELVELFHKAGFEVKTLINHQWKTGMLYCTNTKFAKK